MVPVAGERAGPRVTRVEDPVLPSSAAAHRRAGMVPYLGSTLELTVDRSTV